MASACSTSYEHRACFRASRPRVFARPGCHALPPRVGGDARRRQPNVRAFDGSAPQTTSRVEQDPFNDAACRLQSLLSGVGDGEEEMLNMWLSEEDPLGKLLISGVSGAVGLTLAWVVCWASGVDPLGGASLSLGSLHAAALGALAAAPLVAAVHWSWGRDAAAALPALPAIHATRIADAAPWLAGMAPGHVAALVAIDSFTLLVLLLPATQGALGALAGWYLHAADAASSSGATAAALVPDAAAAAAALPAGVARGGALAATALAVGFTAAADLSVDEAAYETVRDAVTRADVFYRLVASGAPAGAPPASARAFAFKAVALAWLQSKEDAVALGAALAAGELLYLGGLWWLAGDLTAPAVALLAAEATEHWHLMAAVGRRGARHTV